MDKEEIIKARSLKATRRHLKNMEEENPCYDYLDICWVCNKKFTLFDRLTFNLVHSFEGNSHRRDCQK